METQWEMVESGPPDAAQTVLLLPGGMCSARSYAEVMAEPLLAGVRLVAVTMPGHAGAPPPERFDADHYVRITSELAEVTRADVVVGFSMGAQVALNMVVADAFTGPVVLAGISLSAPDEPLFFRVVMRLGKVLGTLPAAVMKKAAPLMFKQSPLPPARRDELIADFARNSTKDMRLGLMAYADWLSSPDDRARQICAAGVRAWFLHAEKGDGGLTPRERATLEACPTVKVVTLPGEVFLLPNEAPGVVADLITRALAAA